jgi:hypothetical protein
MSGLPDIGIVNAQVGCSRLACAVSKDVGGPSFETHRVRDAPRDEAD